MMKKEEIMLSNQTVEPLTSKELEMVIKMIDDDVSTPILHHISHNICSEERLEMLFGKKVEGSVKDILYGFPVIKVSWVPLSEVWLQDKDGKVIKRFSFNYNLKGRQ